MSFEYIQKPNIPCLAWCAEIFVNFSSIRIYHGTNVECKPNFFFEGAWDGKFADGDFVNCHACFGSGAKLFENQLLLASPSHNNDKLFYLHKDKKLFVSNSLPFLLTQSKSELDNNYPYYNIDIDSIQWGLNNYIDSLPLKEGRFFQCICCNLVVDDELAVTKQQKMQTASFANYDSYIAFLQEHTKLLAENAKSPERCIRYDLITTISSGYDSPAVSLLAKHVGCKESLTIADARRYWNTKNDSGAHIAKDLDMNCRTINRDDYKKLEGSPEIEFFVGGGDGQEVVFAPFEKLLKNKVLFTGCSFGRLTELKAKKDTFNKLIVGDASSSSFAEFRLRVGYIYAPIAYIGFSSHNSIIEITQSNELTPYILKDIIYNKPILRKLLEDYGIARHTFGVDKKAVTLLYDSEGFANSLKPETYQAYQKHYNSHINMNLKLKLFVHNLIHSLYQLNRNINWFVNEVSKKLIGKKIIQKIMLPQRYKNLLGERVFTYSWATTQLKKRYR